MRLSFTWKPISSPGRTEKFPPPLMRFLRSNVGSRSRKARASPLSLRRKKAITTSAIETQEPSSPKVTCIGQVRVRRSKSSSSKNTGKKPRNKCIENTNNCCYCFPKPSSCNLEIRKPNFGKWVSLFNCRSVKVRTDSSKFDSNRFEQEEIAATEDRERRYSVSIETTSTTATTTTTTPPKNALLLTRCRSAPYRSSSLACQFWGSPLRTLERGTEERAQKTEEEAENRALEIELRVMHRDSTSESRRDQDSEDNKEIKDLGICGEVQIEYSKDNPILNCDQDEAGAHKKPLMLMRCKSEPARSDSKKIDPQSSEFWRHRRLGNTESSTPHSHAVD